MPDHYEYHTSEFYVGKERHTNGKWEHAEHMTIEIGTPVRIRVEKVGNLLDTS